ncbi:PIN domain-containing protein [Novilysobacter arseniciresistens]|uniref:PIN domain-containing protein n=1 Tax=Novilysobacter arseniciresistens TaxID=1385522 RepID=UPI000A9C17C8|nr:PIN domain-containing protein [Lysobacter arseniciresistens]
MAEITLVAGAPRIVLDTNVWLDLLVFADPRTAPLREALDSGAVTAVVDAGCREEWQRVLGYPLLRLEPSRRDELVAAFDALAWALPAVSGADGTARSARAGTAAGSVPRCRDPDDQKFLELAQASGARWLLSRDRHLLSLARRCKREGLFEITTPEEWVSPRPTTRTGTTA